jgi:hypothetical protein
VAAARAVGSLSALGHEPALATVISTVLVGCPSVSEVASPCTSRSTKVGSRDCQSAAKIQVCGGSLISFAANNRNNDWRLLFFMGILLFIGVYFIGIRMA